MNQDERDVNRVAKLTKLQAIKETTERLLHPSEENTHTLIMVETIRKGEEIETISRVNLFLQSAEIGSQLMEWCEIGEE